MSRVTCACGHIRLVPFGPDRTSGELCVRCQKAGRRLPHALAGPVLDLETFIATTPSLETKRRDHGACIRLFLNGQVADYWPKREKWHLITQDVRGEGWAELQRILTRAPAGGAEPRHAPIGTTHRPARRSCTPPHLFVCDECQRAYRLGLPRHPKHQACNARLDARAAGAY